MRPRCSYMKATARPNPQLAAPCHCLVTGLQVNIRPDFFNLVLCFHYCDFNLFFCTGRVGPPLPCNDMKLVDVPEMNYFAANGEGEVGSA